MVLWDTAGQDGFQNIFFIWSLIRHGGAPSGAAVFILTQRMEAKSLVSTGHRGENKKKKSLFIEPEKTR
jgi:hypothetical protein